MSGRNTLLLLLPQVSPDFNGAKPPHSLLTSVFTLFSKFPKFCCLPNLVLVLITGRQKAFLEATFSET